MSHAERNDSVPIFWRLGRHTACDGAAGARSIFDGELLAKDAVKKRLEDIGAAVNLSTPEEFRKVIISDIKGFQDVAKTAGLEAK